jgi:hypothetical protein
LIPLPLAYLACFGLFIWLGHVGEKIGQSVKRSARAVRMDIDGHRDASRNLNMISREESRALSWCYHKGLSRIRADQNDPTIESLERMQIIRVDGEHLPWHDRFFVIPPHVMEALGKRLGDRDPDSVGDTPPWLREHYDRI